MNTAPTGYSTFFVQELELHAIQKSSFLELQNTIQALLHYKGVYREKWHATMGIQSKYVLASILLFLIFPIDRSQAFQQQWPDCPFPATTTRSFPSGNNERLPFRQQRDRSSIESQASLWNIVNKYTQSKPSIVTAYSTNPVGLLWNIGGRGKQLMWKWVW